MNSHSGLRVLLISPYPQQIGKAVGGVEAATSALAPALAAQPEIAKVTVLCFSRGAMSPGWQTVTDNLKVLFLRGQNHLELPTGAILNVLRARRLAQQLGVQIVHGQGISGQGHVATRVSRASVVTVHGMVHVEARLRSRGSLADQVRIWLLEAMVRRVLARARVVISISAYDAKMLGGLVRGQRASIPNPVSPEFFENWEGYNRRREILFAGWLAPLKNIEAILRAFAIVKARLDDVRLTLAGSAVNPVYAARLRELVVELGLGNAVEFCGYLDTAELLHRIRLCSVLVLFSHQENSPTVIAQAMAVGKAVVASRAGGIPEMVEDGHTGFLVESGDEQGLAERLAEVMQSPELRRRMGRNAREIARQRFEPSIIARQTVEAYRMAIGG